MAALRTISVLACTAVFTVGCATNPQTGEREAGKTATYGGLGALAGAAVGALASKDDRGKGALIGAAVGGAAGAGYGYYVDKQEAQLRQSMQGTGVDVQRQGDQLSLVMPGNITFATNSSEITSGFYSTLNTVAKSLQQYDKSLVDVIGHTDSVGSYDYNLQLSQRRAQSVLNYLAGQGVAYNRLTARGMGPSQPIADNTSDAGRAQNRRVEIKLAPLPNTQY
ncbi:OmpA family protein [Atopomonas sediminilitoris]|uniref:OmpA family protein n=1 Tax=Atopomonas sediminilitoris TaxID=2919919 RepID=UPI001F4EE8F5|nr:OmpA family protein [Atopomonas sediminilitoris]MCJ8169899.1 OmpA family protein [Atopomonas sediminilitoris]